MEEYVPIYARFYEHLKSHSEYLMPYMNRQASCEKWMQGELIRYLYDCKRTGKINEADLEKNYGRRAGYCDIWFKVQGKEIWCELEVIVTNYGKSGKPITNQVDHVIEDAAKLKNCPENAERLLMFLAYPFARGGRNDDAWKMHMNKIESSSELVMNPFSIPIDELHEARIYLARSK